MNNLFNWINNILLVQDTKSIVVISCAAFIAYLGVVRFQRYKNIKTIKKKYPNPQEVLDDAGIAQDIFATTMKLEFPFMGREGTELALFKTFTIPTISKLLASTGEFGKHCPRRTEDTELLLIEMTDTFVRIQKQLYMNPNTPKEDIDRQWKRPEEAVKRLNEIHGKYNILNDDYIYTLSLFVSEPISWINRYEWQKLDEREINAMFRVWYDIGVKMNIKDIPDTPQKLLDFQTNYAKDHIQYHPSNWKCGEPTIRLLLSRFIPSFLSEQGYQFSLRLLPSILDAEDTAAFQLPFHESKVITWAVKSTFNVRAFLIRHFMLPRSTWLSRTPFYANENNRFVPEFILYKPHIYKKGYVISELGPEKFVKRCPF